MSILNQSFDMWYLAHGRDPHRTKSVLARMRDSYEAGAVSATLTWQPMETAPKNGTRILVKEARGLTYIADYDLGRWVLDGTMNGHGNGLYVNPVGWMPLPSP